MSATGSRDSLFYDTLLDWLVAALFALEGLAAAFIGYAVTREVDRELARDIVADMETQSTFVSEPVLVDAIYNLAFWGGVGVTVLGALYLAAAVAFPWARRRARAAGTLDSTRHAAALGGSLAALLFFVPFATVGGGAIAGYLRADRNPTVAGVLAGVVSLVPFTVVEVFAVGGAFAAGATEIAGLLLVGGLFSGAFYVALSALGGFVAGLLD